MSQRKSRMSFLSGLGGMLAATGKGAGAAAPLGSAIKVKKSDMAKPLYYSKDKVGDGEAIVRVDSANTNKDLTTYRTGGSTFEVIDNLTQASPDLAASVSSFIRTAVTEKFTVVARGMDGEFNRDATIAMQSFVRRMDVLRNYDLGFDGRPTLRGCSESLASEIRRFGSFAAELVLDEAGFPSYIKPVTVKDLKFTLTKKGLVPFIEIDSDKVVLDVPTFFYMSVDQNVSQAYSTSPMESVIQPVLFQLQFFNDLRRTIQNVIHPALRVTVDSEKILKAMPDSYHDMDDGKRRYVQDVIDSVADELNGRKPEDAYVSTDGIVINALYTSSNRHDAEIAAFQKIIDAKIVTGSQTMPSILGMEGSSNIANVQTLLFMKTAAGAVQYKLNDMYSQIFTLAARLMGYDVTVEFKYAKIDLRPESELAAFRAMEKSMYDHWLSLGLITNEEYTLEMLGRLPNLGAPDLSGTGFHMNQTEIVENPDSNTSTNKTTNKGGIGSDAPKNPKSQNGGQKGN